MLSLPSKDWSSCALHCFEAAKWCANIEQNDYIVILKFTFTDDILKYAKDFEQHGWKLADNIIMWSSIGIRYLIISEQDINLFKLLFDDCIFACEKVSNIKTR